MAKEKTKSTNYSLPNKTRMNGYGLKSPWEFDPGSEDSTRQPSQPGAGDFYGTGVRNPVGRSRDLSMGSPVPKDKLKDPPLSLA